MKTDRLMLALIVLGIAVGAWYLGRPPNASAADSSQAASKYAAAEPAAPGAIESPQVEATAAPKRALVTLTDLVRTGNEAGFFIRGRVHNNSNEDFLCNSLDFDAIGDETTNADPSESTCKADTVAAGTSTTFLMSFNISLRAAKTLRFENDDYGQDKYTLIPLASIPVSN